MDVRTLCLGVLSHGDASGYEIKKKLEATYSHFFQASFGSIYPALNRLTEDGHVICSAQPQDKRPDKKVYRITAKGRMNLIEELSAPPGSDRIRSEFLVTMLFSELLSPRFLDEVIEGYLGHLRQRMNEIESCAQQEHAPGRQFVRGFGLAVYGAIAEYVEENRHLVEGEALLGKARRAS
jgi:DNA-binding PadR family transcriptional regulator